MTNMVEPTWAVLRDYVDLIGVEITAVGTF